MNGWMDEWTDRGMRCYFQIHRPQFQEIKICWGFLNNLFSILLLDKYYNSKIRNLGDKISLNV